MTATPETPGWRIRVVPNLYPIVGAPGAGDATGAHEVVILCPDHDRDLAALDDDQVVELFIVLRDRMRVHLDGGRAFAVAFVNHGRGAGASIEHPHAQIVAPDAPAPAVVAMTERFGTDLVAAELGGGPPDRPRGRRRPRAGVVPAGVVVAVPAAGRPPLDPRPDRRGHRRRARGRGARAPATRCAAVQRALPRRAVQRDRAHRAAGRPARARCTGTSRSSRARASSPASSSAPASFANSVAPEHAAALLRATEVH